MKGESMVDQSEPVVTITPVAAPPDLQAWLWIVGLALLAIVAGLIAHAILFRTIKRLAGIEGRPVLQTIGHRLSSPARLGLPALGLQIVLATAASTVDSNVIQMISRCVTVTLILAATWAAVRTTHVIEAFLRGRRRIDIADNLEARRLHTQVAVLARTVAVIVWVVGLAIALMTFPQVRQVGASLLASAGIAGLVVGIAARPIAENLLAGIQIAFTEPIRLDDVVVIEGQWGRIEEITPTYVVVKIWDERRLVVPLSYFISKPIENWTRSTSAILGTVFLYTDYTVPVPRLREELKRILDASDRWDRRGWALQVTDSKTDTLELRALMSAPDGPTAFELRCEVRERLVDFLQREYPHAMPRMRAVIDPRGFPLETAPATSSGPS
jgi:small-conductance mechanosensitive channel